MGKEKELQRAYIGERERIAEALDWGKSKNCRGLRLGKERKLERS